MMFGYIKKGVVTVGKEKYKRYFFIDMENVHTNGFKGIGDRNERDSVRIYYSNPNESIPIELHIKLTGSSANFEYIRVDMPIKSAADCMILLDLQKIAEKNKKAEFIIVSNDTDFDRPIKKFGTYGYKVSKLSETDRKENTEKAAEIRRFIDEHFKDIDISADDDREDIIERTVQAVMAGKTKSQINYNLLKIYDSQSVKLIYSELKPLMSELPGK